MAAIVNGWLEEKNVLWPGQRFSLQLKGGAGAKLLHEEHSDYQHLQVFDSETYGRVLVLDGAIQLTERDEFAYQEMIVHLPMFAHPRPERVLIVGGGDGGVLREVLRHASVTRAVMCEIDRKVCEVGKRFFENTLSVEFANPASDVQSERTKDPRAELHYEDASLYMAKHQNEFDVIIVDSSDPVGPAEALYSSKFYSDMHAALRPGGIVCTQGECQFLHADLISKVMRDAKALYPVVDYAFSSVPTYPSGQIGYIIAHKGSREVRVPTRAVPAAMAAKLRYYSSAIHSAAFVLPAFMAAKLGDVRKAQGPQARFSLLGLPIDTHAVIAIALGLGAAAGFAFAKRR